MIIFTLPIIPRGQARVRATARLINGRPVGRIYKGKGQDQAEENLCALLLPYRPEKPLEGPLNLAIYAQMPIPRSWPKKRQAAAQDGRVWPTGIPDVDNLVKHMMDCMKQVGFFIDDRQVVILSARKYYGPGAPRWHVELLELEVY